MLHKLDPTRDYLGDGVYCSFDGCQVWIWTSNGERESEKIALEPQVLHRLNEYDKRVREERRS